MSSASRTISRRFYSPFCNSFRSRVFCPSSTPPSTLLANYHPALTLKRPFMSRAARPLIKPHPSCLIPAMHRKRSPVQPPLRPFSIRKPHRTETEQPPAQSPIPEASKPPQTITSPLPSPTDLKPWYLSSIKVFPDEINEKFKILSYVRLPLALVVVVSVSMLTSFLVELQYLYTEYLLKPKLLKERTKCGDVDFFKSCGYDDEMVSIASDLSTPLTWTITQDAVETHRSILIAILRHLYIAEFLHKKLLENEQFRIAFTKEYGTSKSSHAFIYKFLPIQFPIPLLPDFTPSRILKWKNASREISRTINSIYYDILSNRDSDQIWKTSVSQLTNHRITANILIPSYFSLYQSKLAVRYGSMMQLILKSIFHQEWFKLTPEMLHDPSKIMQYWECLAFRHYLISLRKSPDQHPAENASGGKFGASINNHDNHDNHQRGLQLGENGIPSVSSLVNECKDVLLHAFSGELILPVHAMKLTDTEINAFRSIEFNELLDFAQFPTNLALPDASLVLTENEQLKERIQLDKMRQSSAFSDQSIIRDFYTSRIHSIYVPTPKLPSIFVE